MEATAAAILLLLCAAREIRAARLQAMNAARRETVARSDRRVVEIIVALTMACAVVTTSVAMKDPRAADCRTGALAVAQCLGPHAV